MIVWVLLIEPGPNLECKFGLCCARARNRVYWTRLVDHFVPSAQGSKTLSAIYRMSRDGSEDPTTVD